MADRATVAAVVLNYNYADFVMDAVRSLVDQDDPFDEIVVVDDGSTDASLAALLSLDLSFRLVTKVNGGQLSAAIAGLEVVSSDYVYFLDADDCALPELARTLRDSVGTQPVKVQFPLQAVSSTLEPTGSVFPGLLSSYGRVQMLKDNAVLGFYTCPPTSGNAYLRVALSGLPLGRLDQRDFIDGPPTLAMPHLGEVLSLPKPLAMYRVHGRNHSKWANPDAAQLEDEISWFHRRWAEVEDVLGVPRPVGLDTSAYVLERRAMQQVLHGNPTARIALQLGLRVVRSHSPRADRIVQVLWCMTLAQPIRRLRVAAVVQRRAPTQRPAVVRALVAVLRRVRTPL